MMMSMTHETQVLTFFSVLKILIKLISLLRLRSLRRTIRQSWAILGNQARIAHRPLANPNRQRSSLFLLIDAICRSQIVRIWRACAQNKEMVRQAHGFSRGPAGSTHRTLDACHSIRLASESAESATYCTRSAVLAIVPSRPNRRDRIVSKN